VSDNDLIQEARRFGGEWGRALADRLEAANARVARIERLLEHVDAARAGYDALVARANRLEKANGVLQRMVREEYPDGFSLAEIASTWGNATPEEIAALAGVPAEPATEEKPMTRYEVSLYIGPCSQEEAEALMEAITDLPEAHAVGAGAVGLAPFEESTASSVSAEPATEEKP
jgi:hypothetical protein